MAQLVASMSVVVLGGVVEIVGSNLARGKIFYSIYSSYGLIWWEQKLESPMLKLVYQPCRS